jgi:hypothetical protein
MPYPRGMNAEDLTPRLDALDARLAQTKDYL